MTKLKANGIGTVCGRLFVGTAEKIPPSEIVDTTGAGDSFIGAVIYGTFIIIFLWFNWSSGNFSSLISKMVSYLIIWYMCLLKSRKNIYLVSFKILQRLSFLKSLLSIIRTGSLLEFHLSVGEWECGWGLSTSTTDQLHKSNHSLGIHVNLG